MEISAFFNSLSDPRRKQGLRYSFESMLWMIFIATASGALGYRKIAQFCKSNEAFFTDYFGLKHGLPSYVSIRTFLIQLDKAQLNASFHEYLGSKVVVDCDWVAADGQTLRSTVQNAHESTQDFCSLVSLYAHRTGLTVAIKDYLNQKGNEGEVFRRLLEELKVKGLSFTLDALHCQKKQ